MTLEVGSGHKGFSDYSRLKSEIEHTAQALLRIAEKTGNRTTAEFLKEVLEKLPNEEVYLAILGLFKRGKSTLINAMLGRAILPTGVIPVTSVITRIRYGRALKVQVSFSDGSKKEVPPGELQDYVTEAENPNNAKNVTIADVYVPAPILREGLILIDTPGVGSAFVAGTKATFQFLDRADFVVFVLAVDPPVGQLELELLRSIASKPNKILFVLNKIDYFDSASLEDCIRYCREVMGRHLESEIGEELQIYPLSAKTALEARLSGCTTQLEKSGITQFEDALKRLIATEKQDLMLKSTENKLQKAISDLTVYAQLEINSLTTPLASLAQIQQEFELYLNIVQQRKRELFYVLDGKMKEIVTALDEDLAAFQKTHEEPFVKNLEAFASEKFASKFASREIVSDVEEYLKKSLIETYSKFIADEDRKIIEEFQQLVSEVNGKMNSLVGDIMQKAGQLFGFQAVNAAATASLGFDTKFYYHLDPIFTMGVTFSGSEIAELLPKAVFKGILSRKVQERARDEFDKNGGRIRYDYFIARLNQAALRLKSDINQTWDMSTETVKRAVQESQRLQTKSKREVNDRIDELTKALGELRATQKQLMQQIEATI